MKIPIAIYTAIEGYAWQPGTELTIAFLNEAKKAIGKFPDASMGDLPFGGAALVGDRMVVFRYHVAKNMDSFGRDALYVVLGAIPRNEAKRVNVKALLEMPTFATPTKPLPAMVVDYEGPVAETCPFHFKESFSKEVALDEALPWLGDAVTERAGKFVAANVYANGLVPKVSFVYEAPPRPEPKVERQIDVGLPESQGSASVGSADGMHPTADSPELRNHSERILTLKPDEKVVNLRKYRLLVAAALFGWFVSLLALAAWCLDVYVHNKTLQALYDRIEKMSHANLPQMPEPDGYERVERKAEVSSKLERRNENERTYAGLDCRKIDRFVPEGRARLWLTNGCPCMILNEVVSVTDEHEFLSKIDAVLKKYEEGAQTSKNENAALDGLGAPAFQQEHILLKPTSPTLGAPRWLYSVHRLTSGSKKVVFWQLRGEMWIWLGKRAFELVDISYYQTVGDAERASRTDVPLRLESWSQKICTLLAGSDHGQH